MAELKTKPSKASVAKFIESIADDTTRKDCQVLIRIMKQVTGVTPRMWGPSIVGFGSYHYRYASGREGDWFWTGFSPRKQAITLYLMGGLDEHAALLKRLGKHKTSKGCLYVKRLADLDVPTLERLVAATVRRATRMDTA
jgi:hypothetical protein